MIRMLVLGFLLSSMLVGASHAQLHHMKVASFNIRYDNPADSLNAWKYRKEMVANLIRFHDFDIFGAQEVQHHQLKELGALLQEYRYVGVGRDDGKQAGEYSPIFYKEDEFKLLDTGTFWLSEDTEKPNKGWDAALPRICTWGKFKDLESGLTFYLFNTHFDHRGVQARKESARLILKKIREIGSDAPIILTGDFNVDQTNEAYHLIHASDRLSDTYERSPIRYGARGTFTGFNIHASTNSRIDHIFVTDHFEVLRHGILTDSYQISATTSEKEDSKNFPKEVSLYQNQSRLPSDHYPVVVELAYEQQP